jgi:hypothetical protein
MEIQGQARTGLAWEEPVEDEVANILERETPSAIWKWLNLVDAEPEILHVKMSAEERSAHLPALFRDLILRIRKRLPLRTRALMSDDAHHHGIIRRKQGYSPAMMVEESRMLQVSIFETLHEHVGEVDPGLLLLDVMVIADEVDSQLAQAMASYSVEAGTDDQIIENSAYVPPLPRRPQ